MSSDPPLFVPPLAPAFTPIVAPPLAQFAVPSAATLAMVPGKDEDAEWFTARDPAGRTYYYHRDGRTSWTAPPSSTPAPSFGGSSTLTPTASASAPTLQGSPVAVVIVSPSAASAESGYVDCCDIGCCGSGSWASITADPERVSWVREERGSCGACCAVCASSQEEAVELRHVVLVEGKSGCVTYVLRFVLGIMLVIGCVVVGLLGNSTGSLLFTAISVSCAVLGVLLLACSCVKESRVHIKTAGDMRPFEAEAVTMMMLPFSSYTRVWDKLRAAWTSHRAARAPLLLLPPPLGDAAPLEWAQRVVGNPLASAVAAAAAATGGAPPAVAGLPVRVPLSPASNLSVSSDGLMEIQGNILCHRESKLAYADAVTWARVPGNCCECCAELQLGVHDDYAAAAMTGANSALVLSALKRTLLRRAPAGVGGGAPASFTAYSQDCFECCCKTTIESDADFVSIRSPCDTVILRTTDVPFVHSTKSAILVCQAIVTVLYVCAWAAAFAIASVLVGSNDSFAALLVIVAGIALAWFISVLLSCSGVISIASIVSCCCRFTSVTVGTLGAASGVGGKGAACCRLCSCRCCVRASQKKFYRCQDDGTASAAFVKSVHAHIAAARRANAAAEAGAPKAN